MGLDTTHDCWHGPYSAFSAWRGALAVAAGYETTPSRVTGHDQAAIDWDSFEWCNFQGLWAKPPADPLLYLIVHSDCDGYLFPEYAETLADRLEELLSSLGTEPFGGDRELTENFIAGLRSAAAEDEIVCFR